MDVRFMSIPPLYLIPQGIPSFTEPYLHYNPAWVGRRPVAFLQGVGMFELLPSSQPRP